MVDLIELGMVDFDVIMVMHWLYSCFAKPDCRTRTVRSEFPNESVIGWKGDYVMPEGYVISREGIKVDPQKIPTVKNWPRPTTPTEIRSFLGLSGYYRKFVKGFSTLASLLTKLTQKAAKFQWKFKNHGKNYPTHDLEFMVVKVLNLRQRRWLELLNVYDIDILYHSGKANVVGDALSRKSIGSLARFEAYQRSLAKEVHWLASLGVRLADSSEGGVIVQNRVESSLVGEVKENQYNDPLLVQLKERMHKYRPWPFLLKVKTEHQRPCGLAQNIEILMWKWEMINMDFVVGLPRTP
ncbi:uncharacterized protein [Nicotiana tomentosiformis]|uniref:uncharacterized protein n=1 Tax=Nicotiana tomentosiformis TaxID=4098 RepID=UPI00388CAEF1